ncbi:unnamed protein product [Meganyctiphanes norvegica]|uniref:C2H2-type domain-containing protein n=1 Tax=Meganyctiphanes norvegica TaxID=48144 RepID=A0AAV2S2B7_MEGNR
MDTDTSDSDTDLTYEEMRPFHCCKCNNRFIKQKDLNFHKELVHAKGIYQCAKCNFSCKGIGQMTVHNRKHIRENRHLKIYSAPLRKSKQISNGVNVLNGSSSNDDSGDKVNKIGKEKSESDKENTLSICNDDSSSDGDSDNEVVSENTDVIVSESDKENDKQEIASSTNSSNNALDDEDTIENRKQIKSDKDKDKIQSKLNVRSSDSDTNSGFDDDKSNNKEKVISHTRNNMIDQETKKRKSNFQLELAIANFMKNKNDKTDENLPSTSSTNLDKDNFFTSVKNLDKNSKKETESKIKDKQNNIYKRRKSFHTSDSESENIRQKKNSNEKHESNISDQGRKTKDNEKISHERIKSTHTSNSENQNKQKHKSKSRIHRIDSKSKNKDVCKDLPQKQKSDSRKSEQQNSHIRKTISEAKLSNTTDCENVNKRIQKSKSERYKCDSENENKGCSKSTSKKQKSNTSKSGQKGRENKTTFFDRAIQSSDLENENQHKHMFKSEKRNSSSDKIKSYPTNVAWSENETSCNEAIVGIETNGASNKEETIIETDMIKQISEHPEIKTETEVYDHDEINGKGKIHSNDSREKTLKPMVKVPKCNIKEIINESKRSNNSENENVKKSKNDESVIRNRQTETEIVRDQSKNKCTVCKKSFERKKILKKHLLSGVCYSTGTDASKCKNRSHGDFSIYTNQPSNNKESSNLKISNDNTVKVNKIISNNINHTHVHHKIMKRSVYSTSKVEELMSRVQKINNQFQCPECLKSFMNDGNMRRHLITHTGEKPFPCTKCDAAFYQKIALQKHMKFFHNEGMFGCKFCNETFVQEIHMKRHMAEHTGAKTFSCVICLENFALERDFKKHMKKEHQLEESSDSNHNTNYSILDTITSSEKVSIPELKIYSASKNKSSDEDSDKLKVDIKAQKQNISERTVTTEKVNETQSALQSSSYRIKDVDTSCSNEVRGTIGKVIETQKQIIPERVVTSEKVVQNKYESKLSNYQVPELNATCSKELNNDILKSFKEKKSPKSSTEILNSNRCSLIQSSSDISHKLDSSESPSKSPSKSPNKLSLKKKLYECPHCDKTFRHKMVMKSHMETHQDNSDSDSLPDINV